MSFGFFVFWLEYKKRDWFERFLGLVLKGSGYNDGRLAQSAQTTWPERSTRRSWPAFSKFELHLWQAVNLWICFWRFCVSVERSSISISRAFMISWFTLISLWLGFEHIFYFILMVTSKFALQRGNMKCVKKHVKKNFHTWWHLHFYFKYPKIVEFHFRLFFRFKIDHVFLFEIIDFCSARNIWNAHFSFSESDGKNGAFKIFWVYFEYESEYESGVFRVKTTWSI